jgi:hypothetical protein
MSSRFFSFLLTCLGSFSFSWSKIALLFLWLPLLLFVCDASVSNLAAGVVSTIFVSTSAYSFRWQLAHEALLPVHADISAYRSAMPPETWRYPGPSLAETQYTAVVQAQAHAAMIRDDARTRLRDRIKYAHFSRLPHRVHAWAYEASSEVASLMESLPLISCLHTINMLSTASAKLARQRSVGSAVATAIPTADAFSSTFLADYKTHSPGNAY